MAQDFLNIASDLNRKGMYYNITKPKSDIPHWSDDLEKKPLEYWNTPKLWGDPKEKGTRFWNEDSRKSTDDDYTLKDLKKDVSNELQDPRFWSNIKGMFTGKSKEERAAAHKNLDSTKFRTVYGDEGYSSKSEKGKPIMNTKKDQFGFGTEQPISTKDVLEMEGAKLDKLLSLGEINQEEYKRLYEILQDQIQQQEKPKGLIQRAIDHQTNIPYHNFQTGQEEIMER